MIKIFSKENLKRAGLVIGGAVIGAAAVYLFNESRDSDDVGEIDDYRKDDTMITRLWTSGGSDMIMDVPPDDDEDKDYGIVYSFSGMKSKKEVVTKFSSMLDDFNESIVKITDR